MTLYVVFLRYVACIKKLPFKEVTKFIDNDGDILSIIEDRFNNPNNTVKVNIDDL